MKISTTTKSSRKSVLIVLSSLVAVVLIGWTAYAYSQNTWPFESDATTEDASMQDTETEGAPATLPTESDSPTDKTPLQYDKPDGDAPEPNALTGVINFASISEGNLVIRNTINQSVASGNCELVLKNKSTGKTITKKAPIAVNPHTATCQGFDIPVSELPSGTWDITISITSDDKKGVLKDSVDI